MLIIKDDIKIQEFKQDDFDNVLDIYKQSEDFLELGPEPYASKEMVLNDIDYSQKCGGCYCTIFYDANIVGIIDYISTINEKRPNDSYINLIMIKKDYRSRGLGQKVLETLEEYFIKENRISSIFISVQENNPKGIAFWIRQGYEIISGPELQEDTTVVLHMKKALETL